MFLSSWRSRWWPLRVEAWVGSEWRPMGSIEFRVDVCIGRRGSMTCRRLRYGSAIRLASPTAT